MDGMHYALIFFLIFGALILLAALSLGFSKDPRKNIFFARSNGKTSLEAARKTARELAAALAGVGIAIVVYCIVGIIRGL